MYLKENYDRARSHVEPAPISMKMDISPDRKPAKVIERQSSIKDGFLKPCYNLKLVNEEERTLLLINQIVIGKNEDNATDKLMNIIDSKIENGELEKTQEILDKIMKMQITIMGSEPFHVDDGTKEDGTPHRDIRIIETPIPTP